MAASAGSFYSTYRISFTEMDADIAAAKRRLLDLRAFAQQTIGASTGGAAPAGASGGAPAAQAAALGRLQGPQQQTAEGALRLASAEARLAVAMGEPARAASILNTALQQNVGASNQATLAVQTQAARLQSGAGAAQQFGDALKSGLLGIVGPAAAAAVVLRSVGETIELTKLGAQAEQTRIRFEGLARTAGTTGDALLAAMRAASGGTISDLNLQLAANRAQLLGVADSAEEFSTLMEIARARAQDMGISTTQAFNDLVTGLGRGSALILDNLGITVSVTEANEVYAKQLGKTVNALTEAEQKQALINAVLLQGKASLDTAGGAAETNAAKIERFEASVENAKVALGGLFATQAGPFLDEITKIADAATGIGSVSEGVEGLARALAQLSDIGEIGPIGQLRDLGESLGLPDVSQQIGATTASWGAFISAIQSGSSVFEALNAAGRGTQEGLTGVAQAAPEAAAGVQQVAVASATAASGYDQYTAALLNSQQIAAQAGAAQLAYADSLELGGVQARAAALAAEQKGIADQVASIDAQTHAVAQAQLTAAAQAAAAALLASGQQGANSAAQLAGSSQLVDILTAAFYRLAAAKAAAAVENVKALRAPDTPGGGTSDEQDIRAEQRALRMQDRQERVAAGTAAAEAEANYQRQLGNTTPLLNRRKNELAQLTVGTAAYYDKLAEINQLEQQGARGGRGAGGGSAASARLTDQQRLENTLLNDQAKYEDQAEAQALEHTRKLLDIQAEFEKKSLAQQRANEVSKRQGRADFYDALTSSSKDLGEKESQALSASYEQAFAKAQEIAQAGNQKLADDYLAMRQQQIQREIEYQKARKQAADDGDKGEVARLDAIRKLQQEADAEKEKQLLAGGDANVNARNDAIAAEDQRYIEQQDKAATAAEKAGQRKIDQATRNGAAIDTENEKLREQERILARIGGRPPGTGAGPAPDATGVPSPSTGAAPTTEGAAGTSPGGDQVWRVFDSGVVDALNAQTERLSGDLAGVKKAIEDLGPRIRAVESAVGNIQAAVR